MVPVDDTGCKGYIVLTLSGSDNRKDEAPTVLNDKKEKREG
jgi:hypothetical protein